MELYSQRMKERLRRFEEALPGYMPKTGGLQTTVAEAMAYACRDGGKRLRPMLLLEFCRALDGDWEKAMPFAAAIEMIHCYSLVHDDLPCMDNSPVRRGRPSTHAAYGEDMALLAGDGLLTLAFETALSPENSGAFPAERALSAAAVLAQCAGIDGMVGGQVIDLESEGKSIGLSALETLQRGKTAALLVAACVMGARLAGATAAQETAARDFGENLGLAFQIVDDILDVTATAEELGKPVGSDAENEKVTYVSLLGLEKARALAGERTEAALAALRSLEANTADLERLTRALLERHH